jgi:hypothetical protein
MERTKPYHTFKNLKVRILELIVITLILNYRNLWLWTEDKLWDKILKRIFFYRRGQTEENSHIFNSPNSKSIIFSVNLKFKKMKILICALVFLYIV